MNKGWTALSWILIVAAQIGLGFSLVTLAGAFTGGYPTSLQQFLITPVVTWLAISLSVYGAGMIGLALKRMRPLVAWLRLATTFVLAAVPMVILTAQAAVVGVENQADFQGIVLARMLPYYTQLGIVFALLGFFVTVWWHRAAPARTKATRTN